MTYTDQEKLDILTELVYMAHADSFLKTEEISFINALAKRLGLAEDRVQDILENPENLTLKVPNTQSKRMVHFHRMMLMMHIDGSVNDDELQLLHEVGLRYGIRKATITVLLDTMKKYPHGEIPAADLISIHLRENN